MSDESFATKGSLNALWAMLDHAANSMVIVGPDYTIQACNDRCKKHCRAIYGLDVGPGFDVLNLGEDREQMRGMLDMVFAGQLLEFESEVPWPDGSTHWYFVRMIPARLDGALEGPFDAVCWDTHDVTRLKRAEIDAQALIENNIGAYGVLDRELRVVAFNRAASAAVKQVTGNELYRGMPATEGLLPETSQVLIPALHLVLEGQTFEIPFEVELDGKQHFFEFTISPFCPNLDEQIEGICLSRRDVTTRVVAQRQLADSERTLRAIFEGSTSAVLVIGRDQKLRFFNRRALDGLVQLSGVNIEYGTPFADLLPPGQGSETMDALERCLAGEAVTITISVTDPETIHLECAFTPFVPGDGEDVEGACLIVQDVTESAQFRARLAAQARLLDEATDSISVASLDGEVVFWNRSASNLYGYTPDEAMGRPLWEITGTTRRDFEALRARLLEDGAAMLERKLVARGGREVIVKSSCTLVEQDSGETRAFFIDTDITLARATERQFMRAQRLESLGALAGGIAHDLGNVLTPIELSTHLLKHDIEDPELLEHVEVIDNCIRRASDLVSRVLTFARGSDGERIDLDMGMLVSGLISTAKKSFPRGVKVTSKSVSDLWSVNVERSLIEQSVLNLLVNARDAVGEERGTIEVDVSNVTLDLDEATSLGLDPGPYVRLAVEDTGSGISPENIEHIFDPFFSTKAPGEGTGLGLATTLSVVKSHGGALRVTSQQGVGSTFVITLPAVTDAGPENLGAEQGTPRGQGELVLVVDDEAQVQQLIERMLSRYGYEVVCASDGSEAVAALAHRGSVSLAIVDMIMPIMDGPSTIRALRRLDPNLPVVAISGYLDEPRRQQLAALSVSALVEKPFASKRLLRTVREAIES